MRGMFVHPHPQLFCCQDKLEGTRKKGIKSMIRRRATSRLPVQFLLSLVLLLFAPLYCVCNSSSSTSSSMSSSSSVISNFTTTSSTLMLPTPLQSQRKMFFLFIIPSSLVLCCCCVMCLWSMTGVEEEEKVELPEECLLLPSFQCIISRKSYFSLLVHLKPYLVLFSPVELIMMLPCC